MNPLLEELLQKVDIVDVVSQHVKLKRAGRNLIGLCPFHNEKAPSFTVSPEKQIYYCFGCQQGGNAVNFVINYEHLTFQEAIESLAARYGVRIQKLKNSRKPKLFDAVQSLAGYYHGSLRRSRLAQKYLEGRGIGAETTEEFGLGYSPTTRSELNNFIKASGVPVDVFLSTGVVRQKEGELYDMFRGRIVIPIKDVNGRVIGFGARAMERDAIPKYVNSPESPVFSKRSALFGVDKARKEIVSKNETIIVEGYFDLISLYASGIRNVVATLGTAVTEEHLKRLRSYSENISFMMDGDEAGVKGALRLIPVVADLDINGSIVALPEGVDPDSFVRQRGVDGLMPILARKRPLLDHFFEYYEKIYGMKDMGAKLALIKRLLPFIETIGNQVRRRLYVQRLAELTGVREEDFWAEMKSEVGSDRKRSSAPDRPTEKKLLGALLRRPELLESFMGKGGIDLMPPGVYRDTLTSLVAYFHERGNVDVRAFLNAMDDDSMRDAAVRSDFAVAEYNEAEMEQFVADYLSHMDRKTWKERAREITQRLSEAERRGDERLIRELLEQKMLVLSSAKTNLLK